MSDPPPSKRARIEEPIRLTHDDEDALMLQVRACIVLRVLLGGGGKANYLSLVLLYTLYNLSIRWCTVGVRCTFQSNARVAELAVCAGSTCRLQNMRFVRKLFILSFLSSSFLFSTEHRDPARAHCTANCNSMVPGVRSIHMPLPPISFP